MNKYMEVVLHTAELERCMSEVIDMQRAQEMGRADIEALRQAHKNARERYAIWSETIDILGAGIARELDGIRHAIHEGRVVLVETEDDTDRYTDR